MTTPSNLIPNTKGAFLSVDEHGHLICITYLRTWGGRSQDIHLQVNTFDTPEMPENCNEEFYLNHKVKPGYVTE